MEFFRQVCIRPPLTERDREWLRDVWLREWGGEIMITKGKPHHYRDLHSVVAWLDEVRVGAATYRLGADECELMSINATIQGFGIGSRLLGEVERTARKSDVRRLWLITSNDNLDALRFYQRRGFRIVAVYPDAVDEARKRKPAIPPTGYYGIPIHDELELEKRL